MKYLMVGLGNPGAEYEETRHNIGFKVVDTIAHRLSGTFETGRLGDVSTVRFKGRHIVLLKPSTFMNLSGKAVRYWMDAEKVPLERVVVITDDLNLPFGTLRLRAKGSDGGHNGLKDIQQVLGTTQYARLRFGIGAEFGKGHQVDYVLGSWSDPELDQMSERLDRSVDALLDITTAGLARAMNTHNGK
ncbi:MAG: aminoacyl-tRNA hydrolase [Bacteroidetes bacterium]|nr:aminoacyl-tRNA hydrolase [Bacteroidota bacterium]MDA0903605.1 aminoacyl-tRNA hydrolase [Bacteroidota bacterium]MDA1242088.1 aminoacyl-tRNA hydrolase [Bacteroidota bacterium]